MTYQSKASGNQKTMAGLLRFKLQLFDWKCPSNQRRTTCNMKGLSILCWRLGRRVRSTYQMTRLKPGLCKGGVFTKIYGHVFMEKMMNPKVLDSHQQPPNSPSFATQFSRFQGSKVSFQRPARKLSTSPRPGDWNPTVAAKKTIGWDLPHWHRSRGSFLSAWD